MNGMKRFLGQHKKPGSEGFHLVGFAFSRVSFLNISCKQSFFSHPCIAISGPDPLGVDFFKHPAMGSSTVPFQLVWAGRCRAQ